MNTREDHDQTGGCQRLAWIAAAALKGSRGAETSRGEDAGDGAKRAVGEAKSIVVSVNESANHESQPSKHPFTRGRGPLAIARGYIYEEGEESQRCRDGW